MKKILFSIVMLMACVASQAKVIKITFADKTQKVLTSSQLSSIDFNDDGTLTVTTFNGEKMQAMEASFDELTIGDDETVMETIDRTSVFIYDSQQLFTRETQQINFVYPSTDPDGNAITLSGSILMPQNIFNGEAKSEGILLFNHFTIFDKDECPTRGYFYLEDMFLANPLNPNYIVVESDFYGFGVTERFPQAYLQGMCNSRANLDCLIAARRILGDMGIDYGPLTFNIGYSSGGFDAMATQKCRDMEYITEAWFDKTFAGGGPYDIKECYRQYVIQDETAYNAVPLLLMTSLNETQKLGLSYDDIFQPEVAELIDVVVMSKDYSSWPVCDRVGREKKIHEILSEPYCDLSSPESAFVQGLMDKLSIANGWIPDASQHIYLMHSRGDDYVPVESARPILSFLSQSGYTPSIIPGKTNLQTNFVIRDMGHLSATLVFLAQSVAAISAWPYMYDNRMLKPEYQQIYDAMDNLPELVQVLRQMESMLGVDLRPAIKEILSYLPLGEDGETPATLDVATLKQAIASAMSSLDVPVTDFYEMLKDSGYDVDELLSNFVSYLNEESSGAKRANAPARLMQAVDNMETTPQLQNERQLFNWLSSKVQR